MSTAIFKHWYAYIYMVSSVQFLSYVQFFANPWTAANQATLPITDSWSLLKFISIELVMPSNHLILCCPLLLPSIFPSIRVFSSESVLHIRWSNIGSSTSAFALPVNIQKWITLGFIGLILLLSEGLSRVFFNPTILQCSAFFMVQLLHPYMTTGNTIALTI